MKSTAKTISGKVNLALLEKADRLFRNNDDEVLIEILQNARRAGATAINVSIEGTDTTGVESRITVQDNGRGIDDFQSLLTLGASDWSGDIDRREDVAGMGFFCLCRCCR